MATCHVIKYTISSPIGNLVIECCQQGLHSVSQIHRLENDFKPEISVLVKLMNPTKIESKNVVWETIDWFSEYFSHPNQTMAKDIPNICAETEDGSFREKVRNALVQNVKSGRTITYRELAGLVSNKGASRAVGSAMSNNPFSIIIPCHRVIKSDGTLGNYGKGCRNDIKKWLLEFEGMKF